MPDETIAPLLGCLYCHSEGTTTLQNGRTFLGFGSDLPVIKCEHCGAVALLDESRPGDAMGWRIRYLRFKQTPIYYYVSVYLGKAGWLSASDALAISTDGYIQRQRVYQTQAGDLSWIHSHHLYPPPPLMNIDEQIYLALRGVTYQEAPTLRFLLRWGQGTILDSGKFYVTDQKLHLLGQRQDWSHDLKDVQIASYSQREWFVRVGTPEGLHQYNGNNQADQIDAQLITAIIKQLQANLSA